jgi:hypothetical protein
VASLHGKSVEWEGGRDLDRSRFFYMHCIEGGRGKFKGRALTLKLGVCGVRVDMLAGIVVCNLVDMASCSEGFLGNR